MTETIAAPTFDTTTLLRRIVPDRRIDGISAILLPIDDEGRPALDGLVGLLERTVAAGLQPAVNMDTGYVNLLRGRMARIGLTDEQRAIRDAVRAFARSELAPRARRIDEEEVYPVDLVKRIAELGVFALEMPPE